MYLFKVMLLNQKRSNTLNVLQNGTFKDGGSSPCCPLWGVRPLLFRVHLRKEGSSSALWVCFSLFPTLSGIALLLESRFYIKKLSLSKEIVHRPMRQNVQWEPSSLYFVKTVYIFLLSSTVNRRERREEKGKDRHCALISVCMLKSRNWTIKLHHLQLKKTIRSWELFFSWCHNPAALHWSPWTSSGDQPGPGSFVFGRALACALLTRVDAPQ